MFLNLKLLDYILAPHFTKKYFVMRTLNLFIYLFLKIMPTIGDLGINAENYYRLVL